MDNIVEEPALTPPPLIILNSQSVEMDCFSKPHICQCLTRIASLHRNSPFMIAGDRRRTGQQFVDGVLRLAGAMIHLGVNAGDVVAISAYNRFVMVAGNCFSSFHL